MLGSRHASVLFVAAMMFVPLAVQGSERVASTRQFELPNLSPLIAQRPGVSDASASSSGGVGFRARPWLKLGMALAALVAGAFAFLIKMVARGSRAGRRGADQPAFSPYHAADAGNAVRQPVASSSVKAQSQSAAVNLAKAPAPATQPNRGMVIFIVVALVGLPIVVIAGAGVLLIGYWMLAYQSVVHNQGEATVTAAQTMDDMDAAREQFDKMQAEAERMHAATQLQVASDTEPASSNFLQTPSGESPIEVEFDPLPSPANKLPLLEWSPRDVVASGITLNRDGTSFRDVSPAGGVLVGFRVTRDARQLRSIQPIYQVADALHLGEVHGTESPAAVAQLLAPPGHVVSALRFDFGFQVVGVQIAFAELVDGTVAWEESTQSEFFGMPVKGKSLVIEGEGDPIVGVSGYTRSGLEGIALLRHAAMPPCKVALPEFDASETRDLPRAGSNAGKHFESDAPTGGVLVGLRYFLGTNWGGAIRAVQPVYQVGQSYVLGERCGSEGGIMREALAPAGYAVGRIDVNTGLVMNSAQLTFNRLGAQGLDVTDARDSARFGSRGGSPSSIDSNGRFLVGLRGTYQTDMISIQGVVDDP